MARIRSLHPSLFTDDHYMALGFPARELLKGIWCEADDQGVFEWKPLSLKARIMPADAVNVAELLDELIDGEFVMRFEHSAHSYGLVRNFRRFQRPKKPNATHLLPPEFRTYVGLTEDSSEPTGVDAPPVGNQFGTGGGKPPQMEDGGCRREKKEEGGGATEPVARAPRRAAAEYAFNGAIVRLKPDDLDRWRTSFWAIPDLRADLEAIDARLVDEGHDGKWFGKVSAWLKARHDKLAVAKERAMGAGFGAPGFA